jgi:RNA polymerase subunit RPABC4/transcription elongation factor Spt4
MAKDCPKCGAPHEFGLILCKFCRTAFDPEEARRATPCPRCKDLFHEDTQKCPRCEVWLVVQCVFCHELTPHNRPRCDACGEVFAGSAERKAARDAAGFGWGAPGPAPMPSSPGSFGGLDAWASPPPEQAAAELFSSFGKAPEPAPGPPAGWDFSGWSSTPPKK